MSLAHEQVAEWYQSLAIQCEVAVRNVELGDDAGLEYATRRALAYMRVIAQTVREIRPLTPEETGPLVEPENAAPEAADHDPL